MNVLVDTNVLLSAALRNRLPESVVRYVATSSEFRWIVTAEIMREYLDVVRRPKFAFAPAMVRDWTDLVEMRTVAIPSPPFEIAFPRDPKDAVFLSAAVSAGADYLITGDNDLLQSRNAIQTRIVSVTEFATEFQIV